MKTCKNCFMSLDEMNTYKGECLWCGERYEEKENVDEVK